MFCLKLWYIFWAFILIESLFVIKNNQEFDLKFKKSDKSKQIPTKFSICFRIERYLKEARQDKFVVPSKLLKRVYSDLRKTFEERKTEILTELKENSTFERALKELNQKLNISDKIGSSLNEKRRKLERSFDDPTLFEKLIREHGSYFRNNLACYLIYERLFDHLNIFTGLTYRLYAYSGKPTFYNRYVVFEHHEYDDYSGLRLMKTIIQECPDQRTDVSTYSFFECYNSCLKKDSRKSIYMYNITDCEKVYLNETQRNYRYQLPEETCFSYCNNNRFCFFEVLTGINSFSGIERDVIAFEFYRSSRFEFWIQFVSLICLFTNTSIYQSLTRLSKTPVRSLRKVFKNRKLVLLVLLRAKWLLFTLCFISTALISSNILKNYLDSLNDPVKSEVANFSYFPETFSVVICVPIQLNLKRKKQLALGKDENLLEKYSFAEIEDATNDDMEMVLKKAYLEKTREIQVILERSEKVYFRNNHFVGLNVSALCRCFRMEFPRPVSTIFREVEKYQDLIVTTNLILELNDVCFYRTNISSELGGYNFVGSFCQIYLLDEFKLFSLKTFQHDNIFQINRKRIKKSRSFLQKNCTDYSEFKDCPRCTRQSFIERCINGEFFRKFRNLSIASNTVIDRDEFNRSLLNKIYFKETIDPNITEECEQKYALEDCSVSYFEKSYRRLNQHDWPLIEINLDFEDIVEKEIESSFSKLLTDLLSMVILI